MPTNAEEFDAYFKKISNWGRWGASDELGTLNLITDAKRRQAASLVRSGQAVGLAHSPLTTRDLDNGSPFEHTMNRGFTTDVYRVMYHGYAHSHMDTLCHILYKDQTYNGYARADVNTEQGCTKLAIHNFRNGYVTRGILMDIPRLKGLPYLEPGTPIFVEDLEAWEKRAGIKVAPGDALLIRTGRWARRAALGPWNVGQNSAGLHASVGEWLKAQRRRADRQRRGARRRAVARARRQPARPHARDHRAGPEHPRQPGSRGGGRFGGASEAVGVPADRRTGARHGRHRISCERHRHVLIASRSDVDGCSLTSWRNPHRLRAWACPPVRGSDTTRSSACLAKAAWGRCIARSIPA